MEWISVKERLPKDKQEALCFCSFDGRATIEIVQYLAGHGWKAEGLTHCYSNIVTHWIQLPAPPSTE